MSSSDIQSKRITGTGSLGVGPARITQIQVLTTTGSPRLTVENGDGSDDDGSTLNLSLKPVSSK